jgi:hypothetical protein
VSIVDATSSSIVAYLGAVPTTLATLVGRVQQAVAASVGQDFRPRPLAQVHATVIGLETPSRSTRVGEHRRFDVEPLADHLVRTFARDPLDIQFGGFARADRRLTSRGEPLHDRTFLARDGNVVLVGWPVVATAPVPVVADIRRGCEPFGVVHRYHVVAGSSDPDVYLVVGRTPAGIDTERLEADVRGWLARAPVRAPMLVDDLSLVEYTDTSLPAATTRRRPLRDLVRDR